MNHYRYYDHHTSIHYSSHRVVNPMPLIITAAYFYADETISLIQYMLPYMNSDLHFHLREFHPPLGRTPIDKYLKYLSKG